MVKYTQRLRTLLNQVRLVLKDNEGANPDLLEMFQGELVVIRNGHGIFVETSSQVDEILRDIAHCNRNHLYPNNKRPIIEEICKELWKMANVEV